VDQQDLSNVLQPVETARGLPNAHYVSDEMFQTEKQRVLYDNWSSIGFAKDIPNNGDAMPISFVGMPLLALRGKDGSVRVFQNVCRHRGMILVAEKKNLGGGVIRCPYHSWCYAQTGDLVTTPHVGGPGQNRHDNIKRDELGLVEIRSYVWLGTIFVNISGSAPEFTEYAADAISRWSEFSDQTVFGGGADTVLQFDVVSNWKLPVENYCESYHLPWIHPGLNVYSRLEDHYHIENPGHYAGQGTHVYRQIKGENGQVFPDFGGLSLRWDEAGEYIALFPNTLLGVQRDHIFSIILDPISKDRTVEHIALFYACEAAATGDEFAALRRKNADQWHMVFAEDVGVVEGMQKGRHGIHFDGGKFSPVMDSPTWCFHQWVALNLVDQPLAAK
jgi:choline monooxygenase